MKSFFWILTLILICTHNPYGESKMHTSPYAPIDAEVLHKPSAPVHFPLCEEDREDIEALMQTFLAEKNAAGLAAPQIGIGKSIIVFQLLKPSGETRRKNIIDVTDGPVLWINPKLTPVEEDGTSLDYEACFSVPGMIGKVRRYNTVRWEAYTQDGEHITGTYRGFLARIAQHEVDHLNGHL
jgi:peptide deformylase